MRVEKQAMKDFKVHPDNWRGFVAENAFLKKAVVKDHPVYEILADELLQKEVYGNQTLPFPKRFSRQLAKVSQMFFRQIRSYHNILLR